MIRLITCVKKRNDVSREQFRRYWYDPQFASRIERMAAMLGAKRTALNITLDVEANATVRQMRGSGEAYDGVLEYWWDNAAGLLDIAESSEASALMEEMKAYQHQFVDFGASTVFFTEAE